MSGFNRRDFLAAAAASAAVGATGVAAQNRGADAPKSKPHKAMIGVPSEALLREWKEAGFEGMESTDRGAPPAKAAAVRKLAEKLGMRIHSVMYGWANFNDPEKVAGDLASVETALKAAAAYGADTVLLVPCRIGGKMPEAWEFDIRFDPATGHLKQVVSGDNGPYAEYIAAHDRSADAARDAVKRLVPAAEKAGIIIALENVWNNMWVAPEFFRNFVASFDTPWVRAYFDIGNHVKYSPPQKWIRTLGKLIVKCHVKDFKLNPDGHGGKFCNIRDGSVDWPAVRAALAKIEYNGWMSIEGGDLSPKEHSRRFDLILAGK
jgi:hexulose-6-phosphate isomerase